MKDVVPRSPGDGASRAAAAEREEVQLGPAAALPSRGPSVAGSWLDTSARGVSQRRRLDALGCAPGHGIPPALGQMYSRLRPTAQANGGVAVNDDASLEREADSMGARAMAVSTPRLRPAALSTPAVPQGRSIDAPRAGLAVQRRVGPSLVRGTEVFDIAGTRGRIIDRVVDPGSVRYRVEFIGETREMNASDLFLHDPSYEPLPLEPDDDSSIVDVGGFGFDDEFEPASDNTDLLGAQHALQEGLVGRRKALKVLRHGKSPVGRDIGASKGWGERVKGFFRRAKGELVVDPREALQGGRHYSDKGTALGAHDTATRIGDATIGNPLATPVESLITAPVGAAVGTNRRAGRTPGTAAIVEEKAGHVFSALGNLLQMVPVIGAASAPLSGLGAGLQEHAKGASKKQATARAVAATGAGAVAGLIPGYGTYSGMVGLINDCRKLLSTVERHGDPNYAHALVARIRALEELLAEVEESGMDPARLDHEAAKIQHEILKAAGRFGKEMRRRDKQDRGRYGSKTSLLEEDTLGSLGREEGERDDDTFDL